MRDVKMLLQEYRSVKPCHLVTVCDISTWSWWCILTNPIFWHTASDHFKSSFWQILDTVYQISMSNPYIASGNRSFYDLVPWIGMLVWEFTIYPDKYGYVGKLPEQHSNPGDQFLILFLSLWVEHMSNIPSS